MCFCHQYIFGRVSFSSFLWVAFLLIEVFFFFKETIIALISHPIHKHLKKERQRMTINFSGKHQNSNHLVEKFQTGHLQTCFYILIGFIMTFSYMYIMYFDHYCLPYYLLMSTSPTHGSSSQIVLFINK
jgi:hypothetical protein